MNKLHWISVLLPDMPDDKDARAFWTNSNYRKSNIDLLKTQKKPRLAKTVVNLIEFGLTEKLEFVVVSYFLKHHPNKNQDMACAVTPIAFAVASCVLPSRLRNSLIFVPMLTCIATSKIVFFTGVIILYHGDNANFNYQFVV